MFDNESDLPWENDENSEPCVVVATADRYQLKVRKFDSIHATDDHVAVEVLLVDPSDESSMHRVAQQVLPSGGAEQLEKFLADPVELALIARLGEPGIDASLIAFVSGERIRAVRVEDEPWLASVDSFDEPELSPLFLGKVVRYEKDCSQPLNLRAEATDLFAKVLAGTGKTLVDKMLESL